MKNILIVDDEQNVRLTFRMCMEVEGYAVREADGGAAALHEIEREVPDVVLLDLRMPAPDGLAVLEALSNSSLPRRPRVIVLTAHGTIQAAKRAIQLGAFDFIEKPVTPETLRGAVAEALHAQEPLAPQSQQVKDAIGAARDAIVAGDTQRAEGLLVQARDLHEGDPEYLNLVGAIHELNRRWDQAHRFYGKAVHRKFGPAGANLRRLYELENFGSSDIPVDLGGGKQMPLVGH